MSYALVLSLSVAAGILSWKDPRRFLALALVTGPLNVSLVLGESLGGTLNLSAIWLLVLLACGGVAIVVHGGAGQRLSRAELAYLAFLAWCLARAVAADDVAFAARMLAKLAYPFLVLYLARRFVVSDQERVALIRALGIAAAVVVLTGGGLTDYLLNPVARSARLVFIGYAALSDYTTMMALLCLAAWRLLRQRAFIVLFGLLAVSPVFFGIRTSILATAVGILVFLLLTEAKAKAAVGATAVYALAVGALFLLPSARAQMFYPAARVDAAAVAANPTTIDLDTVNSSGRFFMWELALDRMFYPSPAVGSGLGASQAAFYGGLAGQMKVVHNEYVRLLCDTGVIGLALFLFAVLVSMGSAWRTLRRDGTPAGRACAHFAIAGFAALLVSMYLDNLLDYVLYATQYPFAFAGMMRQDARKPGVLFGHVVARVPSPGGEPDGAAWLPAEPRS